MCYNNQFVMYQVGLLKTISRILKTGCEILKMESHVGMNFSNAGSFIG
jgi:hypothetical protein